MAANRLYTHLGRLLLAALITVTGLLASEHHGIVKSGGLPVPGATITAAQGDTKVVTTSDDTGFYSFPELADGVWTISVESLGFGRATKDVGVAADAPSPEWDLKYQTLAEITAPAKPETPAAVAAPAPGTVTSAAAPAPAEKAPETKAVETPAPAPAVAAAAATPPAKGAKNAKNTKNAKPATQAANANGRPSLNAALAGGQGGGFTRLGVTPQSGDASAAVDAMPAQDMGDMAAAGNQSFTINGSVSSGLDTPQPGGDWGGGRGGMGPGGMDMGGMGPGPGMGGDPTQNALAGDTAGGGGRGGRGGGGGAPGGGPGGGGGRGGGGAGMMAGIPNIGGGGRGGRGGGPGGPGGRGGRNPGAFGNNRRDPRARYNFAASLNNFTNSFLNARSFSETGQEVNKPSAQTLRSTLTAGGPLKIPHLFDTHNKGTFTINYSLTRNRSGNTWTSLVPTDAERAGNFNGVLVNGLGGTQVPVTIYNGATPIPGNIIPAYTPGCAVCISPIASALLKYYPEPNFTGGTAASPLNFATSATGHTNADNVNARLSYSFNTKNQVNGGIQWQRQSTVTPSEFAAVIPAWQDTATANGVNANAAYIYHFTTRLIATTRYTYSKSTQLNTPYFANTTNVEGALGIIGTDQAPIYWGPPSLSFTGSGILGLSAVRPSYSHPQTSAVGETLLWVHGVHEFSFGGDFSRREANTLSQNNPRGSFAFNSTATAQNGAANAAGSGLDFASFLLGTPGTMSINVANSLSGAEAAQLSSVTGSAPANLLALQNTPSGGDRYLRTNVYDLYVNDQWRLTPRISLSLGLRWDYQAPTTELYNRLATIDLPANFQIPLSAYNAALATPTGLSVVAGQTGPVTGFHYSDSMLNGQKKDISPRIGFAWKPFAKHSTVIRGGWGLYYIPSIYSSLVGQLDAQTPFGTAYNLSNTCGATIQNALSLAAITQLGCVAKNASTTTNAMNPYFRVGYTQNWQMAVQQNLKGNTVATVTYFASKGTGLSNSFYPNSYPSGGSLNCAAGYVCPNGFAYETSNGNSTDEAVQFQLQRRLRSGLGGSVSYMLNKAIDDVGGVAQNWQDIAAERGRTSGISNQTANFSLQYSTGVGSRGGALVNGFKGVLFKDWTVMPGVVLATGAPVTVTAGGLVTGGTAATNMRASYIGGPVLIDGVLNKAAFQSPAAGTYGNLGPAVFNGPTRFSTSLSANRTFRLADRKNLTFSVQMQNPLNHPVVTGWYTSINSTQFGAPSSYIGMRTISANMRFNF
jgi:hypothetical protein